LTGYSGRPAPGLLRLTAVHPDLFIALRFSRRPAGGSLRRLQPWQRPGLTGLVRSHQLLPGGQPSRSFRTACVFARCLPVAVPVVAALDRASLAPGHCLPGSWGAPVATERPADSRGAKDAPRTRPSLPPPAKPSRCAPSGGVMLRVIRKVAADMPTSDDFHHGRLRFAVIEQIPSHPGIVNADWMRKLTQGSKCTLETPAWSTLAIIVRSVISQKDHLLVSLVWSVSWRPRFGPRRWCSCSRSG
jgi:hypothetical protein